MTREQFRNKCLERDKGKCIVCGKTATEVHHIYERRLFLDGGYHINNGASLCNPCHKKAEGTEIQATELCKILRVSPFLPSHLNASAVYDKWGNEIVSSNRRLKGELFHEESVQKILNEFNKLHLFCDLVKYPRTPYVPWSRSKEDLLIETEIFKEKWKNQSIVITEKMDGENTTMYRDTIHARSLDKMNHPSQTYVKAIHGRIKSEIPEGWRICGENLYAKHSLLYKNLKDYFYVFSIWDDTNTCLSWEDTKLYAGVLGLQGVPVLYEGEFNYKELRDFHTTLNCQEQEGYVVRLERSFSFQEFKSSVAKWVRENHVQTSDHWKHEAITKNLLDSAGEGC